MKKIKLRQATLCQFLLYLPALILLLLAFGALLLENIVGFVMFLVLCGLALAYLLRLFPLLFGSDILFTAIRDWKKDRLWFHICSSTQGKEYAQQILRRAKKHGQPCNTCKTTGIKPLDVQYKRSCSLTAFWSSIERILLTYQVNYLDESAYREILHSSDQVVAQLKGKSKPFFFQTKAERKAPACRAVAVIIIAERLDIRIPELTRKLPDFKETAIVPCVMELGSGRCYFDGMGEPYILGITGKPPKNFAIHLIKKVVFNKHLPLKSNPHYDYARISREDLEKPLYDFVKEYFENFKESKTLSKRTAENMSDGEILLKEESLYIKHGEQVAEFCVMQEEPGKVEIMADEHWSYPKRHKISKLVFADLKARARAYFEKQQLQVTFLDEMDN